MSVMKDEPGSNGWTTADVYSNALWSALGVQAPLNDEKREALRLEVLHRARDRSLASANKARAAYPCRTRTPC
ncbi:MAG: calcineurin-like phosphoesterase family protein [Phenylobacterium sp.]|nr:calcineurin-like phosphoesterase family protein [Phenylobacterium sp.]